MPADPYSDALHLVRRALTLSPDVTARELGFTLGGNIYRKGGYVQSYYIESTP